MSPEEKAKADEIYKAIIGKERNTLVKRYGKDAEKVAKGRAIKQAQKLAEKKMESSKDRLKEMVKAALMQEKAGFTDQFDNDPALKGGQKKLPDGLQKAIISKAKGGVNEEISPRSINISQEQLKKLQDKGAVMLTVTVRDKDGSNIREFNYPLSLIGYEKDIDDIESPLDEDYDPDKEHLDNEREDTDKFPFLINPDGTPMVGEDLDLGHTDNEPHMLKGDLYRIGKYAMELYQMVDQFEGMGEVDFPHWWQAKIINAREAIESAKHYLDFETKEPEIDAMVGSIDMSGALDNVGVEEPSLAERIAKRVKEDVVKGSNIRKDSKGKWRVLSGKTGKMWPQTYDSKADAEDALQAYHATKG